MGPKARTFGLTALALVAFASNSLLTRVALGAREIDAATFTLVRLASGAAVLAVLVRAQSKAPRPARTRGVLGPVALFCYAAPFSFAYLRIGAAVGALVVFGVVQLTMVGFGVARGERPPPVAWLGLLLATGGLAYLTVPAVDRPDPMGVALMAVAGAAWGVYSLAGRAAADPLAANAWSFVWSAAMALVLALVCHDVTKVSGRGLGLAVTSGGLTSAIGYAIWYRALPRLSVMQAAVAQLTVPIIAALGASLLLHERPSARFVVAATAVLGGVGLVVRSRRTT